MPVSTFLESSHVYRNLGLLLCLQVRIIKIEKRINEIVNRLNKTKEEKFPNLRDEREERDRLEREDGKQKLREQVCVGQFKATPVMNSDILQAQGDGGGYSGICDREV